MEDSIKLKSSWSATGYFPPEILSDPTWPIYPSHLQNTIHANVFPVSLPHTDVTCVFDLAQKTATLDVWSDGGCLKDDQGKPILAASSTFFAPHSSANSSFSTRGFPSPYNAEIQGAQQTIFFIPQKVSKNGTNFTVTKVRHWIDNQAVSDFCNSSEEPTLHDANRTELKRLRLLTKRLDAQHIEYKSIHTYSHIQNKLDSENSEQKILAWIDHIQNLYGDDLSP